MVYLTSLKEIIIHNPMSNFSLHAADVLRLLKLHRNVLLIGPPATGKSMLMAEIKSAFAGTAPLAYDNKGKAPFPRTGAQKLEDWMPSPSKTDRQVFEITFHQGTKHRHFVSGISPKLSGQAGFEAAEGVMLKANRHAVSVQGSALLCIDEINRGPAVSIFGDTLSAIESDKRLDESNNVVTSSAPFYAYTESGMFEPCYLSPHLYLLASMNEADTSVEPLDVAFLRRFLIYRLYPDIEAAAAHLGLAGDPELPDSAEKPEHVYGALWRAWRAVNERIALGRSPSFEIGHGVIMWSRPPKSLPGALAYAEQCWSRIEAHVDEVFYGSERARAVVYNADEKTIYRLHEAYFGDQPVTQLRRVPGQDFYKLLREVAKN